MNPLTPDPYASPLAGAEGIPWSSVEPMRGIVTGWEKLRLIYNGALLVPGLLVIVAAVNHGIHPLVALVLGLMTGVGANVCFLLGPLTEVYICALFRRPPMPGGRRWLFGAGVLFSLGLFGLAGLVVTTLPVLYHQPPP